MATAAISSPRQRRGMGWWAKRVLLGFVIVLFILLSGTALVGAVIKARLKGQHPPQGQMVDLGGYQLHLNCQGQGTPTVILDAGAGAPGLSWALVQPAVASFTRVCAYDRAGLGWSDPSPQPRTNQVMVEELHTLLQKADIAGPYVLAGHSLGGLNMKLYAHLHPQEVLGLVLVDASHEAQYTSPEMQDALAKITAAAPIASRLAQVLVVLGLPALNPALLPDTSGLSDPRLPPDTLQTYQALRAINAKPHLAAGAELAAIAESHAAIRALNLQSLGDLPLIVIRHGQTQAQMMAELTERMEEINEQLQAETAALSSQGQLVVAEQSGHNIVLEQPEIVVDAIRQIVTQAQTALR